MQRIATTKRAAGDAAVEAAAEALNAAHGGTSLSSTSTFAALVEDWYAAEQHAEELRPRSLAKEYWTATKLPLPVLGTVTIRELTVPICEQAYRTLLVPRRPLNSRGEPYGEPRALESNARAALWVMRKVIRRAVTHRESAMSSAAFGFARDLRRGIRDDFELQRAAAYERAVEATNGALLNARRRAAGIDAWDLFIGNGIRANAYASDELKEHWREVGRVTFADFERQSLSQHVAEFAS